MELTFSLSTIRDAATSFRNAAKNCNVIAFHGQMGAGKTTFIHAFCDIIQVKDVVSSPTFSIINQYNYTEEGQEKKMFHIDLYRLKDEEEAIQAGVEDCFYSGSLCFVEWPERAEGLLPGDTLHVELSVIDSLTRKLTIRSF
jgi:tRNA threonylcarbamoyladenosine biosynthesis protein TsaE